MLEQEIALLDRSFKNLMRWNDQLIKSNHKLYLGLITEKVKKKITRHIVVSYISVFILLVLLVFSIFNLYLIPSIDLLLGTIAIIFFVQILFEVSLRKPMDYKTLLNLYRLAKGIHDIVIVKLKAILEYDLISTLPNYKGYKTHRSRLEKKLCSYLRIQKSLTKTLLITSVLHSIEILFALLAILFFDSRDKIIAIFSLAIISSFIIIPKFGIDYDNKKIEIDVHLKRYFAFFDYLIQNESFSQDMAEKYLDHYYYYDYSNFKFIIICKGCDNMIRVENLTQKEVYCSKCKKDIEIKNLFVYVANFKLNNLCIRCGHKNTMWLCPPYDINIICEQCGLDRGKLYPPIYLKILFSWLGKHRQIGMIISFNNHGDVGYHYILFIDKDEKFLIPIPNKFDSNFLMTISLEKFKELDTNKVNIYEWIDTSIGENIDTYNFPTKVPEIEDLRLIVNDLKGCDLEYKIRMLLNKRDNYSMDFDGKNVNLSLKNRRFLNKENCLKDMSTTTKEIDLFGIKNLSEKDIIVIGECTNRNKVISMNKIKKFIITANILSEQELNKKKERNLEFHLIIASYGGFPGENMIQKMLEKYWTQDIEKIIDKKIELLDIPEIIKLFKQHGIRCAPYLYKL